MKWLDELVLLVPSPESRGPLTLKSFSGLFLPPVLLYYATAVLVLIPRTFYLRLALLPLTLWSAFRVSTQLDLSAGYNNDRLIYMNQGLLLTMTTLAIRAIVWTSQLTPYARLTPPKSDHTQDQSKSLNLRQVGLDALDLSINLRGCGWNWSKGLHVPTETRPTSSSLAFARSTFFSFVATLISFDTLHYSVQWFSPATIGSAGGGSIYDMSLPPLTRYLRSSLITFLSGMTVCTAIQTVYHSLTLVGITVFGQDPLQWPPIFNAPWVAKSLAEFWAKRWHQVFRDIFISFGSKPLSLVFGKLGSVMGAFLVSGILHAFGQWGMGRGSEFWNVAGYFLIMGVGVILEHTWRRVTGHRVGGIVGHLWTLVWVIGWGNLLVDSWCRKGLVGSEFFPPRWRPVNLIFKPLYD